MINALEKKHRATEGIRILRGGLGPLKFKEGRPGGFPVIDIFEQRFILMSVLSHKDVSEDPSGIRRKQRFQGKTHLLCSKNSKEASAAEGLAGEREVREEMGLDGLGICCQY